MPSASTSRVTLIWMVAYLAVHHVWHQTVFGNYSFVALRVFFLLTLLVFVAWRGEPGEIRQFFVGRFWPDKAQWRMTVLALVLAVVLHAEVAWLVGYRVESLTLRVVVDNCIIAPLNEEIVFRGVFLTLLLQAGHKEWVSIVVSSLAFVGCHNLWGPMQIVPLLTQSLLYGYAFVRTGSVPLCIACHALWNAFVFVPFGGGR